MTWIKGLSIKHKIIWAFSGIYFLVMIILLLLNLTFTDDFFIAGNFRIMEQRVEKNIEDFDVYEAGGYDDDRFVDVIKKETGSDACLLQNDYSYGKMLRSTEAQLQDLLTHYLYIFERVSEPGDVTSAVIGEGKYTDRKLLYIEVLPSGERIVLMKAMGMIMEAQEMFVRFLYLSGIITYLIGLGLVILFADRFTRPIKKVEQTAYQISQLNFDEQLDEGRKDEIGSLNHHINRMASELSTTIQAYNDSNQRLTAELNKERNMEAMREQFVSDVSHELKNPISMIIGYAEGLNRGLAKTEEDRAFYNKVIIEEGERMSVLVEELLDLSSYRSGSITLEKDDLYLSDMVQQAVGRYQMIQEEKGITMELGLDESLVIQGDPVRMGQVINNLLDNAFKYTDEGGTIKVTVTGGPEQTLTVANTGTLIPDGEFEKIWNSFYQMDTGNKGSGIGLAIVKSIVELHHFRIDGFTADGMNHFCISF